MSVVQRKQRFEKRLVNRVLRGFLKFCEGKMEPFCATFRCIPNEAESITLSITKGKLL
tara:strand:+ start:19058 stop:19231 length:174 start_codon:yes stop_codon:yes gene_type:complete